MKLGKKRGIVHDQRTFQFDKLLLNPERVPSAAGTGSTVTSWPLFANDRAGDCTIAAHGHRIVAQEASSRQQGTVLQDEDILEGYSAISGYNPATGENDNGAYLLDALNYMRTTGIGHEKDGTRHTIAAFAQVDPKNHSHVKQALWMFGGMYTGAGLPLSASDQIDARQPWHMAGHTAEDPDWEPYGWGGHCLYATGYDATNLGLITWGRRQKASWAWWDTYVDEAYAVISEDYLFGTGNTPRGFNVTLLQQYLSRL